MRHVAAPLLRGGSRKRWRYVVVSVISVVVAHTALIVCFGVLGWSARVSNLVAFVAGALPGYTLHRRWTWGRTDRSRLLTEVAPYWALSAAGLAASTWSVGAAEHVARALSDSRATQTLVVLAAAVATTGAMWIVKYLTFDRLVFARAPGDTVTRSGRSPIAIRDGGGRPLRGPAWIDPTRSPRRPMPSTARRRPRTRRRRRCHDGAGSGPGSNRAAPSGQYRGGGDMPSGGG